MSDFRVGDTVRLKIGGPTMTVSSIKGEEIECTWNEEGEVKFDIFESDTLEPMSFEEG